MSPQPCPRCGGFVRTPEPYVQSCMNCGWLLEDKPTPVLPPFEDTPAPDANERQKLRARVRAARRLPAHPCRYCGGIIAAGSIMTHHAACHLAWRRRERLILAGAPHAYERPCAVCGVNLPIGHRRKVHDGACRREWMRLACAKSKAKRKAERPSEEPVAPRTCYRCRQPLPHGFTRTPQRTGRPRAADEEAAVVSQSTAARQCP